MDPTPNVESLNYVWYFFGPCSQIFALANRITKSYHTALTASVQLLRVGDCWLVRFPNGWPTKQPSNRAGEVLQAKLKDKYRSKYEHCIHRQRKLRGQIDPNIAKGPTDPRHWILQLDRMTRLNQQPLFKAKISTSFEILLSFVLFVRGPKYRYNNFNKSLKRN